jgi:Tfp pilus assembly protein PilO
MGVVGEYDDVARFLTEIASLPRIVTPVEVEIELFSSPATFPELDSPVQANFRIETFVLPEAGTTPSPQAGG